VGWEEWQFPIARRSSLRRCQYCGGVHCAIANIAEEFTAPLPISWMVQGAIAYREKQHWLQVTNSFKASFKKKKYVIRKTQVLKYHLEGTQA
jgi:hypothetical protein